MKHSPNTIYTQAKRLSTVTDKLKFLIPIMNQGVNCSDIQNQERFSLLLCYLYQRCNSKENLTLSISNLSKNDLDKINLIYKNTTSIERINQALYHYQNNDLMQTYQLTQVLNGIKPDLSQPLKNAFDAIDTLRSTYRDQNTSVTQEVSNSINLFCNGVTQDLIQNGLRMDQTAKSRQQSTCHKIIKASLIDNASRYFTHRHRKARSVVLSFCFTVLTLGLGPVIRKLSGAQSWVPCQARTTRHKYAQRFLSKHLFNSNQQAGCYQTNRAALRH